MATADELANRMLQAWDDRALVEPVSKSDASFDIDAAYDVLASIARERRARGWSTVGRKIGFTNRTIWELYNVDAPMCAHVWDRTVHTTDGEIEVPIGWMVQPRLEPEVVFRLRAPVPPTGDPGDALDAVASVAAGFELVQCHYPDWRFTLPDCTASFGLHAALVVGPEVPLTDETRPRLRADLSSFEATLRRDGTEVARGVGANVLDGPHAALAHLARVVAEQPQLETLEAGELVTTGTITDAQPISPGETWTCDYGLLGLPPVTLRTTH